MGDGIYVSNAKHSTINPKIATAPIKTTVIGYSTNLSVSHNDSAYFSISAIASSSSFYFFSSSVSSILLFLISFFGSSFITLKIFKT